MPLSCLPMFRLHVPLSRTRSVMRPMRHPALALALAGALLLGPGLASAQNLQMLYKVARGYDATFLAARLQAEAVLLKAEQAQALRRPTVNAVGGVNVAHGNTPWASVTQSNTLQGSVGLNAEYTVFNRSIDHTLGQSELQIQAAQAQLVATEQELAIRVSQAYFELLAAQDALTTVRVSKAAIAEQLAAARHNFELGNATITDAREAEARFDLARAQELATENDLNTAQLALDHLVGRQGLKPQPLALPMTMPNLLPADPEEWVRLADANSPVLRQMRLGQEAGKLDSAKARAAGLPTVVLNGAVSYNASRASGKNKASDGTELSFGPNQGTGAQASVGLQLSMPLYTGGAQQGRVKETLVLEQKTEAELEAARRTLAQTTRTGFFAVRSLMARVEALQAAEGSSKMALEATQMGYQVGVRVNLDVLNAQTQRFQAERDSARARYDLLVAMLRLRQTAGVLKLQDMVEVSGLLTK